MFPKSTPTTEVSSPQTRRDEGHRIHPNIHWCQQPAIQRQSRECRTTSEDMHTKIAASSRVVRRQMATCSTPLRRRHCDEQLRMWRCGLKQTFPPLGAEALVKKRRWNAQRFLPTMDRVTYIAPCWGGQGHWVKQEDGTTIVARFCIADVWNPVTDHSWLADMTEMPDPFEERRRHEEKDATRVGEDGGSRRRTMGRWERP